MKFHKLRGKKVRNDDQKSANQSLREEQASEEDAPLVFVGGEAECSRQYNYPLERLTDRLNDDEGKFLLRHELGLFTHVRQISKGCFATVFKLCVTIKKRKSRYKSFQELACKVFNFGFDWTVDKNLDEFQRRLESFDDETVILREKISHKHIRRYIASFEIYCTLDSTDQNFILIRHFNSDNPIEELDELPLLQTGILMELVDGTLNEWKRKYQFDGLTEDNAKKVFLQIGEALVYLHEEHHLIHNDLNGTSIGYVGYDDELNLPLLKLIDFGNASCLTEEIYNEAEEICKDVKLKDIREAKKILAKQPRTEEDPEENPFLVESILFGKLIIGLMASNYDVLLSAERVREKFINSEFCQDFKKLKKILVQMSDPKKGVTVRWALKNYSKKKFLKRCF